MAGSMRRWMANSIWSCDRSASTADCMSAYCSLQASGEPSLAVARCTWPSEAAAAGSRSKAPKRAAQSGAELGHHAPLDEGPAHRRGLALQLGELLGIFGRQHVGNGGEELRHLHQRALEAAERGGERRGIAGRGALRAEKPRPGDPRRDAADIGADARIARRPRREAVFLAVPVGHEDPPPGKIGIDGGLTNRRDAAAGPG